MKGTPSKAKDGMDVKTLPDGTKIIKRPNAEKGPTLEVQPPENDLGYPDDRIRVKVRYL